MKKGIGPVLLMLMLAMPVWAAEASAPAEADQERIRQVVKEVLREYASSLGPKHLNADARGLMQNLGQDNRNFMRTHKPAYFKPFVDGQRPRATVLTCADSRVHSHAFDATPDGDLFMVRNIGNQIATAEGSIEYGVNHLHTPVLLIVGHSACGAIKAAAGDYSGESGPIRNELDTLQVPKGEAGINSVVLNVNNQVKRAMAKFEEKVISGELIVVGAVYDFRDDLKQGQGKLVIVNVNGETDARKLAQLEIVQATEQAAPRPRRSY
ncbi:carbonic anhydrase [Sulfuritortus calidifontis]|uniref:carbonic anhydrase n=1 Tax=Sulfuritortus calidifontis TaxID=1914471 RepID=A0A4R3JTP1_9PROT|nr:carbonic anhydrase [Sulfuritortus calidifontis]TCS70882.1 carbonic anhydrase [Sulfuritortus calidifontis]